jgi:hypothetical protein
LAYVMLNELKHLGCELRRRPDSSASPQNDKHLEELFEKTLNFHGT